MKEQQLLAGGAKFGHFVPSLVLLICCGLFIACTDRAVPDPSDENIFYAQDCEVTNSQCQGAGGTSSGCVGTYREQKKKCENSGGTEFCTMGLKKVKLKGFVGTCKIVDDLCSCADKTDIVGQPDEVEISTCSCVTCGGGS